jgi:hypothetical protein
MQSMDDAIKELDSNVGGQDAKASLANVEVLRDGLTWAEKYFLGQAGSAARGRPCARRPGTLALVAEVDRARETFDAASNGVRAVVQSCKACHEAYKPPE